MRAAPCGCPKLAADCRRCFFVMPGGTGTGFHGRVTVMENRMSGRRRSSCGYPAGDSIPGGERGRTMIRIVFMDIDGTLIPYGEQEISRHALKAVRLLQDQGILVFGVTGRCANQVPDIGFDGVISYDGACVQDKGKIILEKDFFEDQELDWIMQDAKDQGRRVVLAGEGEDPVQDPLQEAAQGRVRLKRPWLLPDETVKEQVLDALEHRTFDKGIVVARIMNILKIPAGSVMAIGDGFNDMGMLAAAGISAAMKEAPVQVQACANFTADGVLDALEHAGLIAMSNGTLL